MYHSYATAATFSARFLGDCDLQISLVGQAVGFGMVVYQGFKKVVENTIDLIHRTAERKMGRAYRTGAGRPSGIFRPFVPTLSVGRPGSFAVTLRLGVEEGQQTSFLVSAPQVIDDILAGIELIDRSEEEQLKKLIDDSVVDADLYRRSFISSTRDMAPDGKRFTLIGFTSRNKAVGLRRLQTDIEYTPEIEVGEQVEREPVPVTGVLDHALSRESRGIERKYIEVTSEKGRAQRFFVDEGMIDVVRSYFGQMVEVKGISVQDEKGDVHMQLHEIHALE